MQAVKPHILVVELCADRANVMQMDEETIVKEAKDLSLGNQVTTSRSYESLKRKNNLPDSTIRKTQVNFQRNWSLSRNHLCFTLETIR